MSGLTTAPQDLALTVLGVLVAGWVTVDALLRKRDVAAAFGWIGLAWVWPVYGGALYFIFGINRVTRRARRFHGVTRPLRTQSNAPDAAAGALCAAPRPSA